MTMLSSSATRRLTILYLAALTSIALLSIVGQILIQWSIQQQTSDALVINIAGKQRMLSQQISKNALILVYNPDPSTQTTRVQELQTALITWKQVHEGLQHGDTALALPKESNTTVIDLYQSIQANFTAMYQAAQEIVSSEEANTKTSDPSAMQSNVKTILLHEKQFLAGMNKIVEHYQSEAEKRVSSLHTIELVLLCTTLVVLIGEALFIFRPAANTLRRTINEIVALEKSIAQQKQELESGIEQILKTHVAVANGDFHARAPLTQDHVLWQMAYSLNNLLARFHSLLQIEANSRKLQIDAKQAISSSQARATQLKEELTLIHTDMTRLATLIRDAKTKKSPIPVVGCHTMVGSLYQELGGSYVSSSGGL